MNLQKWLIDKHYDQTICSWITVPEFIQNQISNAPDLIVEIFNGLEKKINNKWSSEIL